MPKSGTKAVKKAWVKKKDCNDPKSHDPHVWTNSEDQKRGCEGGASMDPH